MNPYATAANVYKEQAILTAPRLKIVQVLYDEAISALKKSKMNLEQGQDRAFRESLVKAQSIVAELFASLNYEQGQAIAENLAALYQFSIAQLMQASQNKTPASIDAVLRVLSTLEQGWDNITDSETKET